MKLADNLKKKSLRKVASEIHGLATVVAAVETNEAANAAKQLDELKKQLVSSKDYLILAVQI